MSAEVNTTVQTLGGKSQAEDQAKMGQVGVEYELGSSCTYFVTRSDFE